MSERRVIAGSVAIGDLRVGRMAYGAMRITGRGVWGEPRDRGEARRVLRRVVELGVDLIDTADSYGPAVSEELIAQALHPYPEHLAIATKGVEACVQDQGSGRDGRPEHLKKVCEESLARLRLEQIPLYQLHSPDPNVPIEDSIGALRELQQEGKVKHIGVSNVTVHELERAQAVAPIVSVQNRYNALDRHSDALVERCERQGLAFLPWAPLAKGDADVPEAQAIADRHGASASQVLLAWLLARSPVMVPIPGTSAGSNPHQAARATSRRPAWTSATACASGGTTSSSARHVAKGPGGEAERRPNHVATKGMMRDEGLTA